MGLIGTIFNTVFGGGRNVVVETAQAFRENAENGAARDAGLREQAIEQFGQEFAPPERGLFDRIMDGINRVPRPALALGTLGLFISAMVDPVWFGQRMQGIALVPEPLWWLLGAIVSFYFGARHQMQGQAFQRSIAQTMANVPTVVHNISAIRALESGSVGVADTGHEADLALKTINVDPNPALVDWKKGRAGDFR